MHSDSAFEWRINLEGSSLLVPVRDHQRDHEAPKPEAGVEHRLGQIIDKDRVKHDYGRPAQ